MLRKRQFQYILCILGFGLSLAACREDWNDVDPRGTLKIPSEFQISLDTVLGNTASSVYRFNFRNPGAKTIVYSRIYLQKEEQSPFSINVDGQGGPDIQNVRVLGKDSLYLFVCSKKNSTVHRDYIRDTLVLVGEGEVRKIPIRAYMEQVTPIKDRWIWTAQTSFTENSSYLLEKGFEVPAGEVVTLPAGVHFYFVQNDSTCVIRGTLRAGGTVEAPIVFSSNRTDRYYHKKAGQWAGLTFTGESGMHTLQHVHIRNANTACTLEGCDWTAENCILSYSTRAILSKAARMILSNCLLYGHWMKTMEMYAGSLRMTHCALYANENRGGVLMQISSSLDSAGTTYDKITRLRVCNSILYGNLDNEILLYTTQDSLLKAQFQNNLLRISEQNRNRYAGYWPETNNWPYDPAFSNPDQEDFTLKTLSPARNKSLSSTEAGYTDPAFDADILGHVRLHPSDLGPYGTP